MKRLRGSPHLVQLLHQVVLGVQAPGRVDAAAHRSRGRDFAAFRASKSTAEGSPPCLVLMISTPVCAVPYLQLLDRRSAKRVCRAQQHRLAPARDTTPPACRWSSSSRYRSRPPETSPWAASPAPARVAAELRGSRAIAPSADRATPRRPQWPCSRARSRSASRISVGRRHANVACDQAASRSSRAASSTSRVTNDLLTRDDDSGGCA